MVVRFLKQSWLVIGAALVFGLLVAVVAGQLEPRIEKNKIEKRNRELHTLFQGYGQECQFAEQVGQNTQGQEVTYFVATGADGQVAGYAIEHVGGGFADKIVLLVAVDADLERIQGYAVMKSNETPGFGDKIVGDFQKEFVNCSAVKLKVETKGDRYQPNDDIIVAITGATVSSEAVTKIVNEAVAILEQVTKK